jgi:hypothetical protein
MEKKQTNVTLDILVNFSQEYSFIKEHYPSARRSIGATTFRKIIAYNILGAVPTDLPHIQERVVSYLRANKKDILSQLEEKKEYYKKIWKPFEKDFFDGMRSTTDLPLLQKVYHANLTASCFWGGDYDEQSPNIYINPLLKQGDPFYVICHELSHLLYWEFIYCHYGKMFIKKNHLQLWQLSELMVNYPLRAMNIGYQFPLIIPPNIPRANEVVAKFPLKSFQEIIDEEIKRARER